MIEIAKSGRVIHCKIESIDSPYEALTDGAACVGLLIEEIARVCGADYASAFVEALRETLENKEIINGIIQEGIDMRGGGLQ